MKSGIFTTEFWHSLIAQGIALLTLFGVVNTNDTQTIEEALGKCLTGIAAIVVNALIVFQYIQGRYRLKVLTSPEETKVPIDLPAAPRGSNGPTLPLLLGIILTSGLGMWLAGGPVRAQSILPWRNQIQKQIDDLRRNQPQPQLPPQPPQILVIPAPLQTFPIAGDPRQQFPIQGEPKQQLPIQGDPKQQLPIPGQPKQDLPIGGPIQQQFPAQPPNLPPAMPPAGAGGPQPYSKYRALGRPMDDSNREKGPATPQGRSLSYPGEGGPMRPGWGRREPRV